MHQKNVLELQSSGAAAAGKAGGGPSPGPMYDQCSGSPGYDLTRRASPEAINMSPNEYIIQQRSRTRLSLSLSHNSTILLPVQA